MSGPGRLVVVATPIGNLGDLAARARATLADADVLACEDTRHTGRLLAAAGVRARRMVSLHAHNEAARTAELIELLAAGALVALVSDAGTPLVSDPGARLVVAAIAAGVEVSTVPGPSAALAALVVSGLPHAQWRFEGFLPRKGPERAARLDALARSLEPSVLYESPRRIAATLADLTTCCGAARRVVVARELTKLHEEVWRGTLGEAQAVFAARESRGEHVLVLDGAPRVAPDDAEMRDLAAALGRLRRAGLSRRDAVVAAETLLGVAHRTAYAAALAAEGPDVAGPPSEPAGEPPVR